MTPDEIVEQCTIYFRRFIFFFLFSSLTAMAVYQTPFLPYLKLPSIYIVPILLIIGIYQIVIIYLQGTSNLPIIPFLVGAFSIIGGASFDMLITVIKTPDLSLEGNPIARVLLDNGFSLSFVYFYGLFAQILLMAFGCMLWAAFLRHREILIIAANPESSSFIDFHKATHGGKKLTWRQFLFPLKFSERPQTYYLGWLFVFIWLGAQQPRWYLGLEWLDITHGYRVHVAVSSLILFVIGYEVWLILKYKEAQKKSKTPLRRVE